MKVDFNPHAAAQAMAQAQTARGPQAQATSPAPEGSDDGVTISLSQAAQSILKNGGPDGPGNSPAHMAALALENDLEHTGSFGQLVKTYAQGNPESSEVPEDGGDTGATTGTTDTTDTGTTEGDTTTVVAAPEEGDGTGTGIGETEPTVVVEEPDITEILDDSAPSEGDATESGGIADSGDAVAAVDTGDITDELLDQLDGNDEEVV